MFLMIVFNVCDSEVRNQDELIHAILAGHTFMTCEWDSFSLTIKL
jgi:hypothetical protein